jgi:hypothetical protein
MGDGYTFSVPARMRYPCLQLVAQVGVEGGRAWVAACKIHMNRLEADTAYR